MIKKKKLILLTILIALIGSSLYLIEKAEISYSVVINKPIEEVWQYASDSTKASNWSVYFTHISPLPGIKDGMVGSKRRCFRRVDETGMSWDEEVMKVTPLKYRRIRTYNLKGTNLRNEHLAQFRVHQRYKKITKNKTQLTFASKYDGPLILNLLIDLIPIANETIRIFKYNLENIKAHIEMKGAYKRIHPYEPFNVFDKKNN